MMTPNKQRVISAPFFFLLVFLYQLCFIFQGVDFSDEGFYGVFYQNIYSDPGSVTYAFSLWLSGIIGGAYLKLFDTHGLLALRFGGVLVITSTMFLVHQFLKKVFDVVAIRIGLFLALILISNDPKDLNYDNLSSLFFVCAAWSMYEGLTQNKGKWLFISGIFITLNFFTRLPTILGVSLFGIIIIDGLYTKEKFWDVMRKSLLFISGFVFASLTVILVMKMIGHFDFFVKGVKDVFEEGQSETNSHGILQMIKLFRYEYTFSLIRGFSFLLFCITIGLSLKNIRSTNTYRYVIAFFVMLSISILLYFEYLESYVHWYDMLSLITGLSLIAALIEIFQFNNRKLIIAGLLGVAMAILQPLGSDYGMYSMGRYSLWLILPFASNYYLRKSTPILDRKILPSFLGRFISSSISVDLGKRQLSSLRYWVIVVFSIGLLYYSWTGTWHDTKERTKMTFGLRSDYMKGVFTTREEAKDINELLLESEKYVKPGDYVLAYDLMPLYHPMTKTKSFLPNPWPYLYEREKFEQEMENSLQLRKKLPVVIYQKIHTLKGVVWPDTSTNEWDLDVARNTYIKGFLKKNNYRMIWENRAFRIYIPMP